MITHSWKAFGSALIAALLLTAAGNGRADTVIVTTPLPTGTNNWYSTNEYVLSGLVHLLTNSVLNIEAGTVVKGSNTGGAAIQKGGLVVCQGGKIFAEGTPDRPIIFTAAADDVLDPEDLGIYQRGLWGGVIIMGRAVLNSAADSTGTGSNPKYEQFEGLPPEIVFNGQNVHRFGGSDDDDNSGVLRYVSIRHAGAVIEQNKEINGLSLCAVGRGTTIEFVEAYATADDGFEFFGGTVNTRYLVSAFNDDDSFDTDQGHSGKHQFWFAIQPPDKRNYGLELNGEVNGTTGLTPRDPISNFQVYNLTIIGAGVGTAGAGGDNTTMLVREYSAPRIYNSIFTDFAKRGIEFGPKADLMLTNGSMQLCNNLWWGYTGGVDPNNPTNIAVDARGQVFFTDSTRSNVIADPMLTSISRTNDLGLDPRPRTGSPAYSDVRAVPNDGFFSPVSYKGAFGPNDLWITKWTALYAYGIVAPNGGPNPATDAIVVTDPLPSGTNNWHRTNTYILSGLVHLLTNSVLNIEAGTIVKGSNTGGAAVQKGGLVVCQGGKIFAEGTPQNPIIFTAAADDVLDPEDLGIYQRGLWGGVIIMGRAVLNSAADSTGTGSNPKYEQFEGLPPEIVINGQNVHRFGGSDDDDNSGVLRYVSIRHAGAIIEQNKEINGLSLCAVGRGTTIEFVEAYATADDGFEFFGGTVNTRYLVSAFNDDDSFDTDQGYSGKNQFWFAIQPPDKRNYGLELNGEVNGTTGLTPRDPISNFQVYNLTIIGAGVGTAGAGGDNTTMLVREYSAPRIYNSIFTDFAKRGIEFGPKADLMLTNGSMQLCNNVWWGYTGGIDPNNPTNIAVDVRGQVFFTDSTRSNVIADPMLTSISRTNNLGLDPRPRTGSPAYSDLRAVPNDGFFVNASAKGAFGSQNWASDWTALGAYGVFNGHGGGNPRTIVEPVCLPALLSVTKAGSGIDITFASVVGKSYKLYGSPSIMMPLNSYSEVATMTASGTTSTFNAPTSGTERFFVVRCQ